MINLNVQYVKRQIKNQSLLLAIIYSMLNVQLKRLRTSIVQHIFTLLQLKCPDCDKTYGVPPQPPGTFTKQIINSSCSGYEKTQTIEIVYEIPNGLQNGIHYRGTKQTCYIPKTKEGEELVDLLKQAFDKGIVFTIGRSLQDGHKYQVQFNDLHHKTSLNGGKYGYPDATYS